MIFLHGTFLRNRSLPAEGQFFLWAEEGETAAIPPNHPWAYDEAKLRGLLEEWKTSEPALYLPEWGSRDEEPSPAPKRRGRRPKQPPVLTTPAAGSDFRAFSIALPTLEGRPLPSSLLIAETPIDNTGKKHPTLENWRVEGAAFTPRDTALFLSSSNPNALPRIGDKPLKFAPDLEFCLELLRFAGAMTARQNFLPSVKTLPEGTGYAVWRPVFTGLERDRCESLIRSVPGLCRAVTDSAENSGPVENPEKYPSSRRFVVESLDLLTDALVRLTQSPRSAKSAEEFVHQEWIGRLLALDPSPCAALVELEPQLREWRRPIAATADAPYRLSLRLEEPETEEPSGAGVLNDSLGLEWRLGYYVEPLDDPSLQVGTEKIFSPKSRDKKT
ncbi:MAG: hypothetical protein LBJ22_05290, partial [Synergistaceae bacterium]|nr:hypothetical protein [Synergistaceae bacterium]